MSALKGIISMLLVAFGCGTEQAPLCETPDVDATIVGIVDGTPSTDRRSTAYVQSDNGYCSATILGPHTALTAAHCAGVTDLLVEDVAWFTISETIVHEDYSFPQHDLAILHTDEELPGPYATVGLAPGAACYLLLAQGYGVGSNGALHEREVFEVYRGYGIIQGTASICNGDSGGPLYGIGALGVPVLVGVSSYGYGGDACDGDTGFVDLQADGNGDWVRGHVR